MSISQQRTQAMAADRRSVIGETIMQTQATLIKQMEQIQHLQDENNHLKEEIASVAGTNYDYVKADKMAVLQGEVDALERRYQFEKMRKNDLIKRHQLARLDLLQSRKLKGGVNVEKEQADAVARQISILEGRLDQALGKFNDALSYNKKLRDQIDIIRGERRVFNRVHKRLDEQHRETKRKMADRLEQANRDMSERDEFLLQVQQLEKQIAEEEKEYREQVRQLDMAMLEIKMMRDEQTNMQLEIEGREYELEIRMADEEGMRNMEARQTPSMKREEEPQEEDTSDQHMNALSVEKEVFTITEIMTQIKDNTREDNLVVLREEYQRLGDSNFSLYKKINELTTTKERLVDTIRDLQQLIQEDLDEEMQQKKLIKDLENKLARIELQLEALRHTTTKQRDALTIALGTTEDVYTRIGCNKSYRDSPLEPCTETSLMRYLGCIEERATEILLAFQRHHRIEVLQLEGRSGSQGLPALEHHKPGETERSPSESPNLTNADLDRQVPVILPVVPSTDHNAVSAQRIVRQSDLPSAHLGAENHILADLAEDRVVSHEEIRKQMEMRLISKRDREERAARRRREKEAAIAAGGGGTSPRKRRD